MKKQTLAKLIVLGMVAAMLPISAFASGDDKTALDNGCANGCIIQGDDTERPDRPKDDDKKPAATTPETPSTEVKVETTTTADGKTVAKVDVAVEASGTTATAKMTAEAVASLATQAADSDVIVLNVAAASTATEVVAEIPAAALADLASKTGSDLTVSSPVAEITISNADLAAIAGSATTVSITAKADGDKIAITVAADGAAVAVNGGLKVSVPAKEGAVVYLVAKDGTETVIEDAVFADGKVTITLTGSATIRIA